MGRTTPGRASPWRTRLLVGALAVLAATSGVLASPAPASAHPLGNATVNHYDGLRLLPSSVTDTAVEDIAEIPTYQRHADIDADGNGTLSDSERAAYAVRQCAALARTISIRVGGSRVAMRVRTSSYSERLGAINLNAGRLECALAGDADLSGRAQVEVDDDWDGQGIGWHEITAVATGLSLKDSPFPAATISQELRRYPGNLLSSPLNVRGGTLQTVPGPGASTYALARRLPVAGPAVRALNALANTFNATVAARHLTLGVGLLAVLLSLLLGAGHAFLPGHGKTIMAAYLVGRRGRLRDVVTVGATVTITHTAGVLLLGLAITTTAAFAPTAAEQYLGIVSGLIVAAVGVGLLVSALRRRRRLRLDRVLRAAPEVDALVAELHLDVLDSHAAVSARQGGDLALLAPPRTGAHSPPEHPHGARGAGHHEHPHHDHPHSDDPQHDHPQHDHPQHDHAHRAHDREDPGHHGHEHGDDHDHGHHDHGDGGHHDHAAPAAAVPHSHGGRFHTHAPLEAGFSRGGLVGLGIAGGLVPSPSALLVLLAATALGRTVFGVVLVLGYGLGMAGALSAAGLLLVKLRGRFDRYADSPRLHRAQSLVAVLPVLTALLVLVVGIGLTLRAAGGTV